MKAKRGQAIDALMAIKLFGSDYARDLVFTTIGQTQNIGELYIKLGFLHCQMEYS